jgi:ribose transport system permease protein
MRSHDYKACQADFNRLNRIANSPFENFKNKPEFMGVVLLIVIIILNIIMQGTTFFLPSTFQTLFSTNTPLIILTMAQCIVLLTGNIDLSTGMTMTMVNCFIVMTPTQNPSFPVWLAYVLGFCLAVVVGLVNGFIVGYFRIPPMLATYGMNYIITGVSLLICDKPQGRVAKALWKLYKGNVLGIPNSIFVILLLILVWLYIRKKPGVKEIYALGGNEKNTYLTGISILRTTVRAYVISGCFVGVAGIMWTLMLAAANPTSGDVKTLQSIAAALLGGTLISGGWGSMICGVLGATFLGFVTNTVTYMFTKFIPSLVPGFSVNTYYQDLVSQLIILLGITLSVIVSNRARSTVRRVARLDQAGKDGTRQ